MIQPTTYTTYNFINVGATMYFNYKNELKE